MSSKAEPTRVTELDLSDVDHRVGQPIGGGQLWDPCSTSDIRRWVMAMDYPNPLHWDQEFARESKFGGLVAPQSIAVALDYGHGAAPGVRRPHPEQPPDLRRRGMVVLRLPGSPRRHSCSRSAASTTTRSPTRSSPGRRCSRAATPSTPTSTAPWWRASGRPRSATSPPRPTKRGMFENQLGDSQALDPPELDEVDTLRTRLADVESTSASRRVSTRSRSATRCRAG